jgi:hypothetical protein
MTGTLAVIVAAIHGLLTKVVVAMLLVSIAATCYCYSAL